LPVLATALGLEADDLSADDLGADGFDEDLDEDLDEEDLDEDLAADFVEFGLRRADVEREAIVLETCVQPERIFFGAARLKHALIGIGESAPIRDR
jgi:hypothetical protein